MVQKSEWLRRELLKSGAEIWFNAFGCGAIVEQDQVRGVAVLNGDDPLLRAMAALPPRAVTYGAGAENTYRFTDVRLGAEPVFTLRHGEVVLGDIRLGVPGLHNISNAAGAAVLALELGADFAAVRTALARFPGMHRRFERLGHTGPAAVVDDLRGAAEWILSPPVVV